MCEALREFFEPEIEQRLKEANESGIQKGMQQGRKSEIFASVQAGDYGVARGAEKLNITEDELKKLMEEAGYVTKK
jgi:hypothetical protein